MPKAKERPVTKSQVITRYGELCEQYLKDGRPTVVGIIDRAIAALPGGELTDVIIEAHAVDPLLADEITGIFLESLVG